MFIMENCFDKVMGLFADNLMKAKDWCTAQRQKSALKATKADDCQDKPHCKEIKVGCEDLYDLVCLLSHIFCEEYEQP